jgi:hypothetical protein
MAPPLLPKAELITLALLDVIRQGFESRDDLWYQPDGIARAHAFTREMVVGSGKTCVYILSPDDEENEEMTYEDTQGTRRYDLTVARALTAGSENPWQRDENDEVREEVQNKLVHDAKKLLRGEKTLITDELPSGLVLNVQIPLAQLSAEDTYLPGWAIAYMRLEVLYEFPDAEPGAES